jgi:transcriptional regulator with XRE-family HTH domain
MYTACEKDGQTYTNRIRKNVSRIMTERGMRAYRGLPHMSQAGLYKFLSGKADITVTKLQLLADDLGVSVFELMTNYKEA